MSEVQKVMLSAWLCGGGHHHTTKELAEKCDRYRPAKLRRAAEQEERRKLWQQREDRQREEFERSLALSKRLEDECLKSEIGISSLEFRVAYALFIQGVANREQFRDAFVTPENTLNLQKLGNVSGITVDDYRDILSWINEP